jgi:hypothetical protein
MNFPGSGGLGGAGIPGIPGRSSAGVPAGYDPNDPNVKWVCFLSPTPPLTASHRRAGREVLRGSLL